MTVTTSSSSFGYREALDVLRLVEAVTTVEEFSIKVGDVELELKRPSNQAGTPPAPDHRPSTAAADAGTVEPDPVAQGAAEERRHPSSEDAEVRVVTAPLAGVFYRAPSPGATPFVQVGDRITTGDTIGIVEIMKLMNTVTSTVSGIVSEIVATDGDPVPYGAPLIRVQHDRSARSEDAA